MFLLKLQSGNGSPEGSSASTVNTNSSKSTEKSETAPKEKPSKKNRRKEKEVTESVPSKSKKEKRLSVLPLEASVVGTLLLIVLGGFYVVSSPALRLTRKNASL